MLNGDWCKVYERLAIRFEEKLARVSGKTKNILDTKMKFSVNDSFNKCE